MSKRNNTKEAILQRFYNSAATLWGVSSVENLDPIVRLIMEAMSNELYDIYNEMEDIHVRMLESLSSVLTPSIFINPFPAHAIAQASPVESEPVVYLNRKNIFSDKKISSELAQRGIKGLSFVPVKAVKLVAGKIKYLISERYFSTIEETGKKRMLGQAHILGEKTNNTAWIGLDLHPEVESMQSLSFYFDFPNTIKKNEIYSILPYSKWYIDRQEMEMKAGLPHLPDKEEIEETVAFFSGYDLLNQTDKTIVDFYNVQYLSVVDDLQLASIHKEIFPEEIKSVFPENITESLTPCYWIKVVFPIHITVQDIHDMTVHINTFPIANKTLYSQIHKTSESTIDIVPLQTLYEGEQFIAIEKVSNSYGDEYKSLPYTTGRNTKEGTYTVKRGGIERFDRRRAGEYLERMIDILRNEVASFSSLNADSMRGVINELQENLKKVEVKFDSSQIKEFSVPDYLLLNLPKNDGNDTVFVEYWTTCSELANGLRAGKTLTV
ncbi:MAG: type VI secretion system baseplate subunit TssF [Candidatus Symbiothrix sp.]|jgi:hypothetical protein|nr:type VI secretion system baseplate subunit TssF [Candidatus Symbiothrix sp.]